ncbi:MAG: NADH-quinone oxidoreductase subunit I [Dehalococcoidales bacterium]|nr:NADH-quinone oxidoreductase subunit I [Dehalococcoidales bacterium]
MKFERYGNGIAKGMALTFKHLFRRPITTQYPEEKLIVSRRTRGNQLIWDKDKCIACGACSRVCPVGCLKIETSRDENKKLKVDKIELDIGLCISCGLCVEACPQKCLWMSYDYEKAAYTRQQFILSGEGMAPSEKNKPSGYYNTENEAKLPKQTLLIDRK